MHFSTCLLFPLVSYYLGIIAPVFAEYTQEYDGLLPLHMEDFMPESSLGLSKRADDFSQLDPRPIEAVLCGSKIRGMLPFSLNYQS